MTHLIKPFDFLNIILVDVAGSLEIFSFLMIILISFIMSKFNIPDKIAMILFVLFAVIMSAFMQGIYVLVIIISGIVIFYNLSKMSK